MKISLTTFADFIVASPTKRISCVRKAISEDGHAYQPAQDYWKPLREAIVEAHKAGSARDALEQMAPPSDPKKILNHEQARAAYLKWLGRREVAWSGGRPRDWSSQGLDVRVNPELFVDLDGRPHAIKLYFKREGLSKAKSDPLLRLLELTHGLDGKRRVGVLDVRNGKLLAPTREIAGVDAVLDGEAAAFVAMSRRLNGGG